MQLLLLSGVLCTAVWFWFRTKPKEEKITGNLANQYVWVFYQFIGISKTLSVNWPEFNQSVRDFAQAKNKDQFYKACALLNQRIPGIEYILNKPGQIVLAGEVNSLLINEIKRVSNLFIERDSIEADSILETASRDGELKPEELLAALRRVE